MLYTENYFVLLSFLGFFLLLQQKHVPSNQRLSESVFQSFFLESLNTGITSIMTWQQPNTGLKLAAVDYGG